MCKPYQLLALKKLNIDILEATTVMPQTRGSVDYPSTCGIQVAFGLPDATFRKSGRVSFVRGALPKYSTCIYLSQTVQYNPNMSKTASWAHNTILITIYIQTINPTISNSYKSSNIFHSYTTYIKIHEL